MSVRTLAAIRAVYGAGLLLLPPSALERLARMRLDPAVMVTTRVLGARDLAQAALQVGHPAPSWRRAGAAVDGLHAASMVWLARHSGSAPHRRLAARNARTAALLAAAGLFGN